MYPGPSKANNKQRTPLGGSALSSIPWPDIALHYVRHRQKCGLSFAIPAKRRIESFIYAAMISIIPTVSSCSLDILSKRVHHHKSILFVH
jgi:hypothetical protein